MLVREEFKEIVFDTLQTLTPQEEQDNVSNDAEDTEVASLDNSSQDMARKLDEMTTRYEQLNNRFKRLVEARDALSKQVSELRAKVDEYEELNLSGTTEAIKLLSRLVDEESNLRNEASKNNNSLLPLGHNPYSRHSQFVNLFLKLMARVEK